MSVGQKSTKEKFMKKNIIIITVILITFSLTFIACKDDPEETDAALNGVWSNDESDEVISFNNGDYVKSIDSTPMEKGTYTNNENKIAMQITEIKYNGSSTFYTKETLIIVMELLGLTEAGINKMFELKTLSYFIDGIKLFLIEYDEAGVNIIDGDTYTKRSNIL
jgi:hypothetical protein